MKLVNGDITIKLETFSDRDDFLVNTIYNLFKKIRIKRSESQMKLNIQVIMRDQFETVHFAKMFDKFSDLFLGFLQFEF